jgi:hypothetical protein
VPAEAFTHTLQTAAATPQPDTATSLLSQVTRQRPGLRVTRPRKVAVARAKQFGDSRDAQKVSSPNPLASPAPASESAAHTVPASTLKIEITSTVNEGALAIFAEHELLFTTNLTTTTPGDPIHFEHSLPSGPHQLRVALYKPDKSLRLEKEGLAEIRSDLANTLAVHVNHHSKLLVRRELALDVTWPAAPVPASERAAATAKTSALMK